MMQKLKAKLKIKKGSILGATLIILGIILVSALSFSLVTIQERKASTGENKSNQALQTAGMGVELVMQAIKNSSDKTVDQLAGAISGATCAGGVITSTSGNFKIQLKDENDAAINCSDTTKQVSLVRSVKSVGTAGQNQRAVEVAVAAVRDPGVGTCYNSSDMLYIQFASSCTGDFSTQCSKAMVEEAGAKGCLPIGTQYGAQGSSGSLSDSGGIYRLYFNTNWVTSLTTVSPKACCHKGI
jgi:hypothetical protein